MAPLEMTAVGASDSDGRYPELRQYVVTHFESPSEIFVRPQWIDDRWAAFNAEVGTALTKAPKSNKSLSVGDNVGVFLANWRRGTIVGLRGERATVRLVDIGKVLDVELGQLKELPAELRTSNAYCHRVRIANVSPTETADGTSWSPSAAKTVEDFITERNSVFIRLAAKSEACKALGKIPVHMLIKKVFAPSPFKPLEEIAIDVADWMCKKGLATKNSTQGERNHFDDFGKGVPDWERPLVPKEMDFSGTITFIDDECQIYVVPKKCMKALYAMEEELSAFCKQTATTSCDHWRVNECIFAKYPDDEQWYRAKVTEISADSERSMLKVLYVDYGEQKWVFRSECCGSVPPRFLDIPIKALRCKLDGVVPQGGKYSTEFLNRAHLEIVDRDVHVRRTSSSLVFPLPVIVRLDGDTDLAQKFIREGACREVINKSEWSKPDVVE